MKRMVLSALLASALSWPFAAAAQSPAAVKDAEVLKGIKAVDDGDYDAAIFILDTATRRLAADPKHPDLPLAYLNLGVAYVGKGAEAAAKANFREALKQVRSLALSADKYSPKVINVFEAARDEVARDSAEPASAAAAPATGPAANTPGKKKGGSKGLLIAGGVVLAGGGAALAASGGSKGTPSRSANGGLRTTAFPNEVVAFGAGRSFAVDVQGNGVLTATLTWQQEGVLLDMFIVNLANPATVITGGRQTASRELTLQTAVTAGSYRISVTNSTGAGPRVDTTFTLSVTHP